MVKQRGFGGSHGENQGRLSYRKPLGNGAAKIHPQCKQTFLGGGFKYFLFPSLPGKMIQFDYIIFFKGVETTNQTCDFFFTSSNYSPLKTLYVYIYIYYIYIYIW